MNKKTKTFIKKLTAQDTKTLSQKALKAAEEVGELASVVLPFDGAHATNHRFVDKNKILEECVDTILTAYSIAYDIDSTDDEIDEMMKQKMFKWAELQNRENKAKFPVPFEIHITVRTDNIPKFKEACIALDTKAIVLDLQNQEGKSVMEDVMTSSTYFGDNNGVYSEMKRISQGLSKYDEFAVVREKIETVPWHPAAPSKDHIDKTMPKDCYFETHFGVLCNNYGLEKLSDIAKKTGSHLSRNAFKNYDSGDFIIMMTYRKYDGVYEDFKETVESIKSIIEEEFEVEKVIVEFSVYDTKMNHDSSWILKDN